MPFEIEEGSGRLRLHGRWTVAEAAALGPGLDALQPRDTREFVLDAAGIEALDAIVQGENGPAQQRHRLRHRKALAR